MEISQTYKNNTENPIEATYSFPVAEMAAVCGFIAIINGEKVVGVVQSKEEAFETYDNAISEGKGAYLLEEGNFSRQNVYK